VAATGVDPSDYGALAKALRELFIGFTARLRGLRAEAADLEGQLSVPIEELRAAAAARAYLAQIEDIGLRERLVATADAVLLERAVSIEVGQARLVDLNLDIGNVEADRGLLVECVEGITKED
jgi:hypothetical protein